jgi:hypothetical protein
MVQAPPAWLIQQRADRQIGGLDQPDRRPPSPQYRGPVQMTTRLASRTGACPYNFATGRAEHYAKETIALNSYSTNASKIEIGEIAHPANRPDALRRQRMLQSGGKILQLDQRRVVRNLVVQC